MTWIAGHRTKLHILDSPLIYGTLCGRVLKDDPQMVLQTHPEAPLVTHTVMLPSRIGRGFCVVCKTRHNIQAAKRR